MSSNTRSTSDAQQQTALTIDPIIYEEPITNILTRATKIITQVKGDGFSFKKIIENKAAKIGAPAMITNVFATDVFCIE